MRTLISGLVMAAGALCPNASGAQFEAAAPEFFEVIGVSAADTLNLREGPATAEAVVAELARGTVLRNLGCTGEGARRWCEVETAEGGLHGWAAGRYLRGHAVTEPAAPAVAAAIDNKPPTGDLSCSLGGGSVQSCAFVVSRNEDGAAEVIVTFPDGFERTLDFNAGEVNSPDPTDDVTSVREDAKTIVEVNGVERIEVPDAAIPSN